MEKNEASEISNAHLEPVRPRSSIVFANGYIHVHLQSHSAFARMSTTQGVAAATAGIPVEDLEPAAGLSSASSCIKLSLLGSTFRPVYLHQVFHDERIPGWRPTAEAEMEARATAGVCHAFPCIFASWNQQVSRVCSVISFQMC